MSERREREEMCKVHLYVHMAETGVGLEITPKLISAQRESLCHRLDLSTLSP